VDCSCGYRVEGINEQELIDQLQIHVDRDHQESRFTDEQIREMVASRVYAAERSRDVRQTG
jgi:predicted small metal-binding protein